MCFLDFPRVHEPLPSLCSAGFRAGGGGLAEGRVEASVLKSSASPVRRTLASDSL